MLTLRFSSTASIPFTISSNPFILILVAGKDAPKQFAFELPNFLPPPDIPQKRHCSPRSSPISSLSQVFGLPPVAEIHSPFFEVQHIAKPGPDVFHQCLSPRVVVEAKTCLACAFSHRRSLPDPDRENIMARGSAIHWLVNQVLSGNFFPASPDQLTSRFNRVLESDNLSRYLNISGPDQKPARYLLGAIHDPEERSNLHERLLGCFYACSPQTRFEVPITFNLISDTGSVTSIHVVVDQIAPGVVTEIKSSVPEPAKRQDLATQFGIEALGLMALNPKSPVPILQLIDLKGQRIHTFSRFDLGYLVAGLSNLGELFVRKYFPFARGHRHQKFEKANVCFESLDLESCQQRDPCLDGILDQFLQCLADFTQSGHWQSVPIRRPHHSPPIAHPSQLTPDQLFELLGSPQYPMSPT